MEEYDLTKPTFEVLNVPILYLMFDERDVKTSEDKMWVGLNEQQFYVFCLSIGGEDNAVFFLKQKTIH